MSLADGGAGDAPELKKEEIEAKAKEWAQIIQNKEAKADAERAAMIVLEHGIELPRLSKRRFKGPVMAEYSAPIADGFSGIIYFNEARERDYKAMKAKKIKYSSSAQDNTFLHEMGHHIDAMLSPKEYGRTDHQNTMDNIDKALVEKELSRYALTNRAEFEAELISATLRGKTFSKELLSYSGINHPERHDVLAKKIVDYASGKDICTPVEMVREKFEDMMKVVFRQNGTRFEIDLLNSKETKDFIKANADVISGSFRQVDMPPAMRFRLEHSAWVFSGFKTYHEMNEAVPSLLREDGTRKTFNQFLNDVQKIDRDYNVNYLRAEFNYAVHAAQAAARWARFEEDGDRYDLEYRTAGDERVRESHRALDGITLPPSDPFWEENYPPNGWNCRCTAVQVPHRDHEPQESAQASKQGRIATEGKYADMFRYNPGAKKQLFNDYNPYTTRKCMGCNKRPLSEELAANLPQNELCAACKILKESNRENPDIPKETFETIETKRGKVRVSSLHGKNEKTENVMIAKYFAERYGQEITLQARNDNEKTADVFNHTQGYEQEYKKNDTPTINSIDRLIRDAKKQSDRIVLWINSDISFKDISTALRSRVRRSENIKEIILVKDGKDIKLSREDIIRDNFKIRPSDLK